MLTGRIRQNPHRWHLPIAKAKKKTEKKLKEMERKKKENVKKYSIL